MSLRHPQPPRVRFKRRDIFLQVGALAIVALGAWVLISTAQSNIAARSLSSGFRFLKNESGFPISETPFLPLGGLLGETTQWTSYEPNHPYWFALATGAANTFKVSLVSIVLCVFFGGATGVARTFGPKPLALLCQAYVSLVRNVPLLLQLILWYVTLLAILPSVEEGFSFAGKILLNNRGLFLPKPVGFFEFEWPEIVFGGRNVRGGLSVSPEYAALLAGLTFYSSAFVAEIVRSGLQSVGRGQLEAANALGLGKLTRLRLIILPQALEVMLPPLAGSFLSLTKNSSLAVAIGYPDLVNVGGTVINQSGQAIEVILVWMGVYLCFSLLVAAFTAYQNQKSRVLKS